MNANVEKVMVLILKEAERRRTSAGFSGARDDGGAGILEAQVRFYRSGQAGVMPPEWQEYEKQLDPEYEEYLRLVKKFGK